MRNIATILILMFDVFIAHPKKVKRIKIVNHSSNKIAYKYPISKLTKYFQKLLQEWVWVLFCADPPIDLTCGIGSWLGLLLN